jgi:hypothetical protein
MRYLIPSKQSPVIRRLAAGFLLTGSAVALAAAADTTTFGGPPLCGKANVVAVGTSVDTTMFGQFPLCGEAYLGRYSKVSLVEVEMETRGAYRLEIRKDGKVLSRGERSDSGWSTFNFSSGMNPPVAPEWSPYGIYIINASPGDKAVHQILIYGGPRMP